MSVFPEVLLRAARHLARDAAALFCLFVLSATPVLAQEAILRFVSDVTLRTDGSVAVTENITVRAEGDQIERGIFRYIPTVLTRDDGSRLRASLEVTEVLRDGEPEPFFIENSGNGRTIYIGDADVYIPSGVYRYTISYEMTRMARRFEGYDELFWNATGNYWAFPIEEAVATVTLPEGAEIGDMAGYTGETGSTESAVSMRRQAPNHAVFEAQRRLAPQEGMSVAVSFQKGILQEPEATGSLLNFLSDWREPIVSAIAVLLVFGYYFLSWNAVGRDPAKGTIIPRFHPPRGFSPALIHYIWATGWKGGGWQAFTAALVDLAVKGHIEITQTGKKKTTLISRHNHDDEQPPLPPGEAVIYAYVNSHGRVAIDKETGPGLGDTRSKFISALQTENRHLYFRNNYGYVVLGVLLSLATLVAMVITGVLAFEWMFLTIFLSIFVTSLCVAIKSMWPGRGLMVFVKLFVIGFVTVNLLSIAGNLFSDVFDLRITNPVVAVASIVAINVVFAVLMRAPTVQGRKVMDEIEGFRMYLETAEKERLNFRDEPELTVGRFEEILPYAIALGVEKPWSEHFEAALQRNAVRDAPRDYHPGWYHGSSFSSGDLGRNVAGLASGMSAAMVAAQPASSSSSGSGGGGSSGGGGGGGGGGGW